VGALQCKQLYSVLQLVDHMVGDGYRSLAQSAEQNTTQD